MTLVCLLNALLSVRACRFRLLLWRSARRFVQMAASEDEERIAMAVPVRVNHWHPFLGALHVGGSGLWAVVIEAAHCYCRLRR